MWNLPTGNIMEQVINNCVLINIYSQVCLDKLLLRRLMEIVIDQNLIPGHQFGFREWHYNWTGYPGKVNNTFEENATAQKYFLILARHSAECDNICTQSWNLTRHNTRDGQNWKRLEFRQGSRNLKKICWHCLNKCIACDESFPKTQKKVIFYIKNYNNWKIEQVRLVQRSALPLLSTNQRPDCVLWWKLK